MTKPVPELAVDVVWPKIFFVVPFAVIPTVLAMFCAYISEAVSAAAFPVSSGVFKLPSDFIVSPVLSVPSEISILSIGEPGSLPVFAAIPHVTADAAAMQTAHMTAAAFTDMFFPLLPFMISSFPPCVI